MLFVGVGNCLLFVVCSCVWFNVRRSLFCSLSAVRCVLLVVGCCLLLMAVRCLLIANCCCVLCGVVCCGLLLVVVKCGSLLCDVYWMFLEFVCVCSLLASVVCLFVAVCCSLRIACCCLLCVA